MLCTHLYKSKRKTHLVDGSDKSLSTKFYLSCSSVDSPFFLSCGDQACGD